MFFSVITLGISAFLASGILFRHQRMLTFLAAAGVLFQAGWLLLTLLDRVLFVAQSTETVFFVGSLVGLIIGALGWKHFRLPYQVAPGSGKRDLLVLVLVLVVVAAAWLVMRANGFQNQDWVTHGFFNGDTATFQALIQKSQLTDGLVRENPFAGNGALEYPTLLHAGWATAFQTFGVGFDPAFAQGSGGHSWLRYLPIMTFVQIFLTIPLFFLLWDTVFPEHKVKIWAQVGIVLYVLALSWDNYIYPQSHFFLTGLFLLLIALLVRSATDAWRNSYWQMKTAGGITLLLLLANAVTGVAAVAVAVIFCLFRANHKKLAVRERGLWAMGAVGWVILFFLFTPGEGALGFVPGFSYTAALDMLRLAPVLLLLGAGAFIYLERQAWLAAAVSGLAALAFITFVFSQRNIVIENATRFFYHAVLLGFPFLLSPLTQLWYWLKRELLYTTHSLVQLAAGWALTLAGVGLMLLPAGASVASAHDHLMFQDTQTVSLAMREVMWWIEENTEPDAIFLASPQPPFAIPGFTGRALLRTDYWLSPDDIVLSDVKAAFVGDKAAQEQVLSQADYLLLNKEERGAFEPLPETYESVFDTNAIVIYKLR